MAFVILAIDWHIVRLGLVLVGMGVFTVVFETVIMLLFRFDRFGKSLVYSIMANIGSLLFGILLFLVFNKAEFEVSQVTELFAFYCITAIFEGWLIRLLNPDMRWGKIMVTSFVMNLLSFVSLYFIFTRFLSGFFGV
ncbi:MAG TPA: hypothetical protein VGC95_07045 [Chitinophagaceae bacterium]|jgi:hypothetical protein